MAQREVLIDLPESSADDIAKWWEEADKRRRRDVVSIIVDHLTVKPADQRGRDGLDPPRRLRLENAMTSDFVHRCHCLELAPNLWTQRTV